MSHKGWGQCPVGLQFQPIAQHASSSKIDTVPRGSTGADSPFWESLGFNYPVPMDAAQCYNEGLVDQLHLYVDGRVRARYSPTNDKYDHIEIWSGANFNRVFQIEGEHELYKLSQGSSTLISWEKDVPFYEGLEGHMNAQVEIFDDSRIQICLGDINIPDEWNAFMVGVFLLNECFDSRGVWEVLVPDSRFDPNQWGQVLDMTNYPSNECFCFYPGCL